MSEELERITILLQAKDRDFARAMDRNNKLIARMTRDATKNTDAMSAKINGKFSSMGASALSFGKNFAAGLAGGAIATATAMITSNIGATVKSIASLGDEAKRSGLGLEAFQEWKFVAEQNRISVDSLTDGFKELSLRADEFITTGSGSGAESFRRLGLTASDLKDKLKDPSELMLEIIGRLEDMDKAAQIRIADEVFGGTGGERFVELLSKGEAGIRSTIAAAHEAGAVLDSETIAKADEIDKKWSALTTKASSWLKLAAVSLADLPIDMIENRVTDLFRSDAEGRRALGQELYDYYKSLGSLTDEQMSKVQDIRDGYLFLANDVVSMSSQLDDAAARASEIGSDNLAQTLSQAAEEMRQLALQYRNGSISSQEFASGVASIRDRATDALAELQAMNGTRFDGVLGAIGKIGASLGFDGGAADQAGMAREELQSLNDQKFGGVLSGLGDIGSTLDRLISGANALRNAMPGGPAARTEKDDGRGFATGNADNAGTSLAPTTTPKPASAPSNLDFDWTGKNWGKGGGGKSSRSSDNFANQMDKFKEETAALIAEAEALNNAALGFDEYGIAQDVARRKAELLQAAQNAGKTITPELTAEIDKLASSYADAARRAEEARQRHDEFNSALDSMKSTMGNTFDGLVTGAMSFKDALRAVIAQLAAMAAQKAFSALWTGGLGASTGGILSGLFGFSSGGYTGPGGRNEVAGVAHRGEVIFSQDDVRRAGGVAAVEAARRSGMATAQPARSTASQPQPQATQVYVTPSPYFDARVSEISGYGDAVVSRAQRQAMPGMIRDAQARGLL